MSEGPKEFSDTEFSDTESLSTQWGLMWNCLFSIIQKPFLEEHV